MAATRNDILGWLLQGREKGATHVVVVCDTYDYEDYPVYVLPDQDVREIVKKYRGGEMTKVMEVYDLSQDIKGQLHEERAFHLPPE